MISFILPLLPYSIIQAALNQREEATRDNVYDHFWEKEELWFDFMADTGDGGDSTYTVARLLAKPEISPGDLNTGQPTKSPLKRGNLLLIGGDLA